MSAVGEKVGHIRLVEFLARGGMGDVFVGFDEKLGRRVALKVIRSEHRLDAEAKARFLREARILSHLDHPHICRIYDLIEERDTDVLVLQLIQGKNLGKAIREGLSAAEKLKIALQLLEVLAVAHGQGVIHRDLKPDNVLVEANGNIKILDFGLARTLVDENAPTMRIGATTPEQESVAAKSVETCLGSVMGTPGYMSPEQARGESVTTASDIYSCGLLFQELFTSRPAYDAGLDRRDLLAKARNGETAPITGLDPDLTAFIRRMLSLAPAARPSALDAGERLRWIQDKPRRRRQRWMVASTMVVLALFGGVMTVQAFRIRREAVRANREAESARHVSQFMVDLFKVSKPSEARGNTVTAREILDRGAAKIRSELQAQPLVQARLLDTIGRVYESLGLYDLALPQLETALAIQRRLLGEEDLDVATTLADLGTVWWQKGEYGKAKPLLEQSLAIREKRLGPDDVQVAASCHDLGNLLWSQRQYDRAQRLLERALAIREKELGPDHPDLASTLNSLGAVAYKRGDLADAQRFWERTAVIREKTLGPDHPWLAQTLNNLAVVHTDRGDPTGARPLLERVVRIQEKVLGPNHTDLAHGLSNLGEALSASGDSAAAKTFLERAVRIEEAASPQNPELAVFLTRLAKVTLDQGDLAGARRLYERSLSIRERAFGPEHPELAESLAGLADCDRQQGYVEVARARYERAFLLARKQEGGYDYHLAPAIRNYAAMMRSSGQDVRAAELESLAHSLESRRSIQSAR